MTPEPAPRAYRSRAERRDELLDAAALVVRDGGVEALTTRAVAERAGVAHGVVHYAFGARQHLVLALLERQARDVLPRVLAAAEEHDDLAGALEAGVSAYLALVRAEPERFLLLESLSGTALGGTMRSSGASVRSGTTAWSPRSSGGRLDTGSRSRSRRRLQPMPCSRWSTGSAGPRGAIRTGRPRTARGRSWCAASRTR